MVEKLLGKRRKKFFKQLANAPLALFELSALQYPRFDTIFHSLLTEDEPIFDIIDELLNLKIPDIATMDILGLNYVDSIGVSSLAHACKNSYEKIAAKMIRMGVNLDVAYGNGTPLHLYFIVCLYL